MSEVGYGMKTVRPRVLRLGAPWQVVADRGAEHWRGGQCVAVAADVITLRLHLEQTVLGVRVVDRSIFTAAGLNPIVGDAVAVRVEGTSATDYVVVEAKGTVFVGLEGPGTDQAGSVARGEFHAGAVNDPVCPWVPRYQGEVVDWNQLIEVL